MISDELIEEMYADYLKPMSLAALGRKYNRDRRTIRELFTRRGLKVREMSYSVARLENGQIKPRKKYTTAEIDGLIEIAEKFTVPKELKREWRFWSMEKRGAFIEKLRAKFGSPDDRPSSPFSANVEPFDYASPKAREIMKVENAGLGSRYAKVKIDIRSQGVIWKNQLWFWQHKVGYVKGPWTPEHRRPVLHHVIWSIANGKPVPDGHVLRFVDGNRNNLVPENLKLETRNTICRENQASTLLKKSRAMTSALLKRSKKKRKSENELIDKIANRY